MSRITFTVQRRRRSGVVLTPHRFGDGMFHAHKTNSRNDPEGRGVRMEDELVDLVRLGYYVRMSNMGAGHAPSTVKPTITP